MAEILSKSEKRIKTRQEDKEPKTLRYEGNEHPNTRDGIRVQVGNPIATSWILNLCIVSCFLLFSCGYKESYIAYTKAVPQLPAQPTLQVTVDKETGSPIVSYTDPRDRVTLKPPEHHPIYQTFSNIIESATKIWAIVEIGKSVQSIANRPESTKEVYLDKSNTQVYDKSVSDKDYTKLENYQSNTQSTYQNSQDIRDTGIYLDTSDKRTETTQTTTTTDRETTETK